MIHSIRSNGWFILEWSKRLTLWMGFESLIHTIRSKRRFIQKLNTAVQNWAKTDNIVFKIYHNISFLFTELLYKITFALVIFETNSTHVILLSLLVWYRLWYKYEIKTHTGLFFAPISWILGHKQKKLHLWSCFPASYLSTVNCIWNVR